MNLSRYAVVIFAVFLAIAAWVNQSRVLESPSDGTGWKDVPSRLYVTMDIPALSSQQASNKVQVGDLLLLVDGKSVDTAEKVSQLIQEIPDESTISFKVFRPAKKETQTYQIDKVSLPENFLYEMPPSIYIEKVIKGGAAERAGIKEGDIIFRINGKRFVKHHTVDFIEWLSSAISSLFSQSGTSGLAADYILRHAEIGRQVPFDIIRENQRQTIHVTLEPYSKSIGSWPQHFILGWLGLIGGVLLTVTAQRPMPQQIGVSLLFFGFLLLVILRKDAEYDTYAIIRDLMLGLSIWLVFAMPFQRSQNPHFLPSAIIATIVLWVIFVWHGITPLDDTSSFFTLSGLRFRLFERGPIPPIICWTFLFGFHYLHQIKQKKLQPLLPLHPQNRDLWQAARTGSMEQVVTIMNAQAASGQLGYYARRIQQLVVHSNTDPDLTTLMKVKDEMVAQDEEDSTLAFVPVTWCEAALPLLGFLGTVIGISQAMDSIAEAIRSLIEDPSKGSILPDLNAGFQAMGEAFDTTFLGLAGVLVLSMADRARRKRIAIQLSEGRELMGQVLSHWVTSSSIGKLGVLELELEIAKQFRETTYDIVERVITEAKGEEYDNIREVLFEPHVVFEEVTTGLGTALIPHISASLDTVNWEFISLGLPISAVDGGVVAVRSPRSDDEERMETDWLLRFKPDDGPYGALLKTQHRFKKHHPLFISRDLNTILGRTVSGELMLVSFPVQIENFNENRGHIPQLEEVNIHRAAVLKEGDLLQEEDHILHITVNKKDIALIIRQAVGALAVDILWQEIRPTGAYGMLDPLPGVFNWQYWSSHAESGTLFAAGEAEEHWRLMRMPIKSGPFIVGEETNIKLVTEYERTTDFRPGVVPEQITALTGDQILVLDTQGTLHYQSPKRPLRPLPSNSNWEPSQRGQRRQSQYEIRAGGNGWIAVASPRSLSMWRISRGGGLSPYIENKSITRLNIDEVTCKTMQATADTRFLFAITGQAIPTYAFPQYAIDGLR